MFSVINISCLCKCGLLIKLHWGFLPAGSSVYFPRCVPHSPSCVTFKLLLTAVCNISEWCSRWCSSCPSCCETQPTCAQLLPLACSVNVTFFANSATKCCEKTRTELYFSCVSLKTNYIGYRSYFTKSQVKDNNQGAGEIWEQRRKYISTDCFDL